MSYRQLRNFSEYMKTLGYHRIVSLENFRTPNFELVADALYWLCERYDPSAEISDDISTERARVDFLKAIAQTMASKARIKLNIKALYRADGFAVRELLKIAEVLHKSLNSTPEEDIKQITQSETLQTKLDELKKARNMANEIVDSGSKLFLLLGQENELKKSRENAIQFVDSISMNLESNAARETIERSIREQINSITDNVAALEKMCTDLSKDQKSLQAKIERKQTDLERAEKRLRSLKKVRPAFMEEYDRLETELKMVYESYLERFRNLNYLEAELEKYYEAEREKQRESDRIMRRMQRKLKQEEFRLLNGEPANNKDDDEDEDEEDFDAMKTKKAGRRSGGKGRGAGNIVGSMEAESSDDESSDSAGLGAEDFGRTRESKRRLSGSDLSGGSAGSQFDDEDEDGEGFTDDDLDESQEDFGDEDGEDDPDDHF
uniref:Clusterin-associated protein 1 n=1 Tax=Lotharella globosa TaxID=91324 RepID=A0A7S4DEA2_9EUKA|mmetsp:Transcript_15372/g.31181  ORF Transcript_15372/g.31181 Transcript_15372/m.31181 type:complete len:436 (+) Transcript_15372:85-1392(+)|eukprot:CAMPEP_0167827594 /NCGR_PEP_ID=MMETSP0112_2-20121227/10790_1 /TAXON_ID=91324 /ORGANISM="Lotharella globosa, Strain CCCM811" /LENGTH=435 /DNA_ID=CAMNT_0007730393 /DNA_START=65 /DNA_END=1372 /DNA_ORIENTATION=+